ncbi:MAG: M20/M25/M40 family metallo-hydrolase [Planctomycetes bacterium]|nr:M20/M25/M40 family metallo-hydrolase [Planctomycetota bacterium]
MHEDLPSRLHQHVFRLAGLIGPRHFGRPASIDAAIHLIKTELSAMGDAVRRECYKADGGHIATNLIVERTGADCPDEIVLLGAHYDTVPETPGADDNASAVAVLLETARLLARRRFRRTIRFVAFACEEPPHFFTPEVGSHVHASGCRERGERIVGMLCLEMVGYFSDLPGSQQPPPESPFWLNWWLPSRGNFLAAVGNLRSISLCWNFRRGFRRGSQLPLLSIVLPEIIYSIRLSDNSSFWDCGYPALMLTDTSFLRNPHYHRPTDLPETLDYQRMAQVTDGVAAAIARLAGEMPVG